MCTPQYRGQIKLNFVAVGETLGWIFFLFFSWKGLLESGWDDAGIKMSTSKLSGSDFSFSPHACSFIFVTIDVD